jgi:hypothetical protein
MKERDILGGGPLVPVQGAPPWSDLIRPFSVRSTYTFPPFNETLALIGLSGPNETILNFSQRTATHLLGRSSSHPSYGSCIRCLFWPTH